jgi:hypothetical protein
MNSHNDTSTPVAEEENEKEDHHKNLFYEHLQLCYYTDNQTKLMGQKQLNGIIEIVEGGRIPHEG